MYVEDRSAEQRSAKHPFTAANGRRCGQKGISES